MIVDTHIHLDDTRYDDDLEDVLDRAREGGVKRFIIPGADPKTLDKAVSIAERFNDVYFAVGVHPYDMEHFNTALFEKYATHAKCVAIGECGLDYYRLEGSDEEKNLEKAKQKRYLLPRLHWQKNIKSLLSSIFEMLRAMPKRSF